MDKLSFETDELHEGIYGLRKLAETLPLVLEDPYEWKWVLIVAHNTLQAFMVCAVKGSAGLGALTKESAKQWLEAYEKDLPYPTERLDFFPKLYEKIKGKQMHQFFHSKPFEPTPEQDVSVDKLNKKRKLFVHFPPSSLLMGVSDLPPIIADVLEIIRFLAKESGNILFGEEIIETKFDQQFQLAQTTHSKVAAAYEQIIQQSRHAPKRTKT